MSDATRDRLEGKMDEVTGRGKSAVGDATDDEQLQGEGKAEQAGGNMKQGLADIKGKVDDTVKNLTDR
jgi:uncharacterized protein YjbJ (UPF0337 family)